MIRLRPAFALSAAALLTLGVACSDNGAGTDNQNQNQEEEVPSFPSYCHITEWECEEFDDGPALPSNRHSHQTVVIDHERILLMGGFERLETGSSARIFSCEILNPLTAEVREVDCFNRDRMDFATIQLADQSVLIIGGSSPSGDRKTSVERFDPDEERWATMAAMPTWGDPAYRVRELQPMLMEDGRVFVLRIQEVFGSHNPAYVDAVIYDPEENQWSAVEGLPTNEPDTVGGVMLDGDRVLMVIAEPDSITNNPPPPPENQEPRPPGHTLRMGVFHIDAEEWEPLPGFNVRGIGLRPEFAYLPERGFFLINIPGDDEEPAYGYLFDPDSFFRQQFYEREPAPGRIATVLPGDRVLFQSNDFVQYYDLETDFWWMFDAFPPGLFYSSLVQLDDCRLFGSGERALLGEDGGELRGVDTAFCTPQGEPVDNRDL